MEEPRHFGREHRVAIGALAVLTVTILSLSFLQFQRTVRAPFERTGPRYQSLAEREAAALEAQKQADTDRDGLSDYDELNLFRSSPYLEDTDSDGFLDGQEVATGNDPNCPATRVCGGPGEEANVQQITPGIPKPELPPGFVGSADQIFGEFNAEHIRSLLLGAGLSDEVLSKVDDATLKALYDQALAGTATSTATSTR